MFTLALWQIIALWPVQDYFNVHFTYLLITCNIERILNFALWAPFKCLAPRPDYLCFNEGIISDTQDIVKQHQKMEPEVEAPDNNHNLVPWSGSDGSQELCASESLAESFDEDDISDEDPLDPEPPHTPQSDPGSPERPQPQEWESAGEQQSLAELSGSDEDVSYKEEDNVYLSESRESPHVQTSPVSLSPHREHPDSEPQASQTSPVHSPSSSLGYAADLTLALTLTTEEPQGASNRQDPAPGNRRIESSEEGGSSEAPPAPVFFEISDEGAEQAEKWKSESATDLCRPDRHRGRYTSK